MRPSTTLGLSACSAPSAFAAFAVLSALTGCSADRPAPATAASAAEITGAEVAGPSSDDVAPPADAKPAPSSAEGLYGPLACRASVPSYGTIELYMKWEGASGEGVLRRVAPSGMRYEQRVHAERQGGLVIADDPNAKDITAHAAILRAQNGKTFVRLGDGPDGTFTCE